MKFLYTDIFSINVKYITQIFIDRETKPPFNYNIIVFYEGYGFNSSKKEKQILYYKRDIENYDEALKIFQELLNKLNS